MYDNLIDFDRYSRRLKWVEESYRTLQEAIGKGDEAFWEWRRRFGETDLHRLKDFKESRIELRNNVERQFQERKSNLTGEEKQIFEDAIYLLNASVREADKRIGGAKADTNS